MLQNINDAVFAFGGSLDRRLAEVVEDIERALEEAARRQRDGSAAVGPRIALLDEIAAELAAISSELHGLVSEPGAS